MLAHVANNLMNDLWDLQGRDRLERIPPGSVRTAPVLSGMTTRRGLLGRVLAVNVIDLAILAVLVAARDAWILFSRWAASSCRSRTPPLRFASRSTDLASRPS